MFKLKKWFKWYNKDEDYIIYTLKSSLTYCQRAIEFYQEKGRKEFFGYDYDQGICYNFENYLKDIIGIYNYSFISDLITDMYKSYSNYSDDRFYPIKSKSV